MLKKQQKRYKRHKRVRAKIKGTAEIPRLCVFRSNKHIYAQLINDEKGHTILSLKDSEFKESKLPQVPKEASISSGQVENKKSKEEIRNGKIAIAYKAGEMMAKKAYKQKIKKIIFDKGGYKYHGRVKALADGARKGGLKF